MMVSLRSTSSNGSIYVQLVEKGVEQKLIKRFIRDFMSYQLLLYDETHGTRRLSSKFQKAQLVLIALLTKEAVDQDHLAKSDYTQNKCVTSFIYCLLFRPLLLWVPVVCLVGRGLICRM